MVASRGHGGGGDRKKKKKQKMKEPPPITSDTVVSLSPQGRAMFEQFLAMAGEIAGCPITGEQLLEIVLGVRAELGTNSPDFTVPENLECFKKHLRAFGERQK